MQRRLRMLCEGGVENIELQIY